MLERSRGADFRFLESLGSVDKGLRDLAFQRSSRIVELDIILNPAVDPEGAFRLLASPMSSLCSLRVTDFVEGHSQDFELGAMPNLAYLVLNGCFASFNTATNPTPFGNLLKLDLEHIHTSGTKFLASLSVFHKLVDLKLHSITLEWDTTRDVVTVTLPQLEIMEVDSCEDAEVADLFKHLSAPSMSNFHFRRGVEDGHTNDLAPFHSFCGLAPVSRDVAHDIVALSFLDGNRTNYAHRLVPISPSAPGPPKNTTLIYEDRCLDVDLLRARLEFVQTLVVKYDTEQIRGLHACAAPEKWLALVEDTITLTTISIDHPDCLIAFVRYYTADNTTFRSLQFLMLSSIDFTRNAVAFAYLQLFVEERAAHGQSLCGINFEDSKFEISQWDSLSTIMRKLSIRVCIAEGPEVQPGDDDPILIDI
ncbi:hypothetical protein EYR36_000429 [Pleurotus pulmonarius]|nr:hypothetical protein EYR36_000429 [Pleurotus pulmonarius]